MVVPLWGTILIMLGGRSDQALVHRSSVSPSVSSYKHLVCSLTCSLTMYIIYECVHAGVAYIYLYSIKIVLKIK